MKTLYRTLHPEVRVIDSKAGLVEYIASDESLDSYREIIRADGWRFNHFKKNAPFVDSHDYSSIEKLLGKVVDFRVEKKRLVETVQWAKDVAANELAAKGWAMTEAGYLKAVSVGFWPVRMVSRWDSNRTGYDQLLAELELSAVPEAQQPRAIYLEQEQIELSAVVIGANPNALARAYKAGIIDDAFLETISRELEDRERASAADEPGDAAEARRLARAQQRSEKLRQIAAKL